MKNEKLLLIYLTLVSAVALALYYIYGLQKNITSLLENTIPGFLSMLVVFLLMHHLFYKRNIDINAIVNPKANSIIIDNFIHAARRIEKSQSRRAESYDSVLSALIESNAATPNDIKKVSYLYKVISEDIFESYRTLMEAWCADATFKGMYSAICKSTEYLEQAVNHTETINKALSSIDALSESNDECMKIMILDLSKAIGYLKACSAEILKSNEFS